MNVQPISTTKMKRSISLANTGQTLSEPLHQTDQYTHHTLSDTRSTLGQALHTQKGKFAGGVLGAAMVAAVLAGCGGGGGPNYGNVLNWIHNNYPNAQCEVNTSPSAEAYACVISPQTPGNVEYQNSLNYNWQDRHAIDTIQTSLATPSKNSALVIGYIPVVDTLSDYPDSASILSPAPTNPYKIYQFMSEFSTQYLGQCTSEFNPDTLCFKIASTSIPAISSKPANK